MRRKPKIPDKCNPGKGCFECTLPPNKCPNTSTTKEEKEMFLAAELNDIRNLAPYYAGNIPQGRPGIYTRPEVLKAARLEKGLTVRKMGEAAQVAHSWVIYSEHAERRVNNEVAERYAAALGKEMDELFTIVYKKRE